MSQSAGMDFDEALMFLFRHFVEDVYDLNIYKAHQPLEDKRKEIEGVLASVGVDSALPLVKDWYYRSILMTNGQPIPRNIYDAWMEQK